MAAETTSSTVTELINSEWIRPVLNQAAKVFQVCAPFCLQIDLVGKHTNTAAVPQEVSDIGTIGDVDGPGEAVVLPNIAFETTEATVSCTEFGILRFVTDQSAEDNVLGAGGLYNYLIESGASDMGAGIDSDVATLCDAFSTTVGATTVDLSLANMVQAMGALRKGEMRAPGGSVFLLDDQQAEDYEVALAASTSTVINNMHTKGEGQTGLDNGFLGTFLGAEVWQTGAMDTANAGADVTGALLIRGDAGRNPLSAAFALATARRPTPEMQRVNESRAMKIVVSQRMGVVEAIDAAGVSIITDA